MKILLAFFFLLFSSSLIAEDISDFEIEGISIGENLFDYFSKQEIKNNLRKNAYTYVSKEKNKYFHTEFYQIPILKTYDAIQISYKKINSDYFKIVMIGGMIPYEDMDLCLEKQKEINSEINLLVKNSFKDENSYTTKQASINRITYDLNAGYIKMDCVDWNDDIPWVDHMRITISDYEFDEWKQG